MSNLSYPQKLQNEVRAYLIGSFHNSSQAIELCSAGLIRGTGTLSMAVISGHTQGGGMPPWQQNTWKNIDTVHIIFNSFTEIFMIGLLACVGCRRYLLNIHIIERGRYLIIYNSCKRQSVKDIVDCVPYFDTFRFSIFCDTFTVKREIRYIYA